MPFSPFADFKGVNFFSLFLALGDFSLTGSFFLVKLHDEFERKGTTPPDLKP